jgi:hypothetical protein
LLGGGRRLSMLACVRGGRIGERWLCRRKGRCKSQDGKSEADHMKSPGSAMLRSIKPDRRSAGNETLQSIDTGAS